MSALVYWTRAVLSDALIVALFYAWQAEGIEQAGNVAVFWVWFLAISKSLGAWSLDKTSFADRPRPAGFIWYHGLTEFVTVSALVWFDFIWLPVVYLIGTLAMEGARNREPKAKAVAS